VGMMTSIEIYLFNLIISGSTNQAKMMQRYDKVVVKIDWQNAFGEVFSAFGTPLIDFVA
jgi:hypothetical protein